MYSTKDSRNLGRKRILIIEDDYVNYLLITDVLAVTNYIIIRASSIEQAYYQLLIHADIDLVIINIAIPGNEHCKAVKILRKKTDVPIIVLASVGNVEEKLECLEAGCDAYINHNIDKFQLISTIDELLGKISHYHIRLQNNENHI
jgi:two-component system, sensor histidine kinase ChiS